MGFGTSFTQEEGSWLLLGLHSETHLARSKACLVSRRYSQMYGIDYQETFSSVAKLSSARLLISFGAIHHWLLHQIDTKDVIFYGILDEEVYM